MSQGSSKLNFLIWKLKKMKIDKYFLNNSMINFWEIGASGSLRSFHQYDPIINYTGFEPEHQSVLKKNDFLKSTRKLNNYIIHNFALSVNKFDQLKICKHPGCSSLVAPNYIYLDNYRGSRYMSKSDFPFNCNYEVIDNKNIKCNTPQDLKKLNIITNPDIIQIDIQGLEYEVLLDFPNLENVLLIDVELSVGELYVNQIKFDKICNLLYEKGFQLLDIKGKAYARRIDIIKNNMVDKGELIQFDGLFIKIPSLKPKEDTLRNFKIAIILEIYGYYSSSIRFYELALKSDIDNTYKTNIQKCYLNLIKKINKENKLLRIINIIKKCLNFIMGVMGSRHRLVFSVNQ